MTARTPEDAATLLCPLSRTFAPKEAVTGCRGPGCAWWRWQPIHPSDPRVSKAIAEIKAGLGGGQNRSKEALEILMADRLKYGVPVDPEVGYCGGAGDHKK
jgi:hypothetical protein